MAAAHYKAGRLVAIVDRNRLQIDGGTEEVMALGDVATKFRAFGWRVVEIDGHDFHQIVPELQEAMAHDPVGLPTCLVAHTVKGKGVSFMENVVKWHGTAPSAEEATRALAELA
jgi:transketolase